MKCHWCGASIPDEAKICPHCRGRLKREVTRCPYCKEKIRAGLSLCPHCGYELGRRRVSRWLMVGVSVAVLAIAALAVFFLPLNLPPLSLPTFVSIASLTPTEVFLPPTPTPEPPAFKYEAPRLIEPPDDPQGDLPFPGGDAIWLKWESVGALAEDEFYGVSVRFVGREGQVVYRGDRVRETTWRVPEEYHSRASLTERAFEWDITVEREKITDGTVGGIPISPTSETWVFYWR